MLRIRARSVHPVTAPPIEDGAVLVDADGRIAAVGPNSRVPAPPGVRALEFSDAVLVPGLVNCHTHLELTHLAGKNAEREFAPWIRAIRALKDGTTPAEFSRSAEQGVRDCWAAGVTCVADTGSTGAPLAALARLGGRGIYYQEVFGPDPAKCGASLHELVAAVQRLRPLATGRARLGVSPHAPYTVSDPLYRATAELARRERLPVALHLAESREETALVRDGAGPFADALRARGIPLAAQQCSPVQYLLRLGVLESGDCLAIHCVQVDEQDIAILRDSGVAVAACPRSNRPHGHGAAPRALFPRAPLRLGFGCHSVAGSGAAAPCADAVPAGVAGVPRAHAVRDRRGAVREGAGGQGLGSAPRAPPIPDP